jgi:hypothetical protein
MLLTVDQIRFDEQQDQEGILKRSIDTAANRAFAAELHEIEVDGAAATAKSYRRGQVSV